MQLICHIFNRLFNPSRTAVFANGRRNSLFHWLRMMIALNMGEPKFRTGHNGLVSLASKLYSGNGGILIVKPLWSENEIASHRPRSNMRTFGVVRLQNLLRQREFAPSLSLRQHVQRFNHESFRRHYSLLIPSPERSPSSGIRSCLLRRYRPHSLRQGRLNHTGSSKSTPQTQPPSPNPTPHLGSPAPAPTLSQRLRKLSREYGWTALWVYLALSAVDFPFCLLAVRMLGTERIGRWEHTIVKGAKDLFWQAAAAAGFFQPIEQKQDGAVATDDSLVEGERTGGWGVEEADKANKGDNASELYHIVAVIQSQMTRRSFKLMDCTTAWATQLALAYAVHKSFIFVRVPLTAAVLPRVVKTLRGWGWDIGKRRSKASAASPVSRPP